MRERVRFTELYTKTKLDNPGEIGQNNGTGSKVLPASTGVNTMKVPMYEYAVMLIEDKGAITIKKASSGGYIPTDEVELDDLFGAIIESRLPINPYSLWLVDGDYTAFGIKTIEGRNGKPVPASPITTAQFKKILAGRDVYIGLTKRPFPQPKIIAHDKNKPSDAKVHANRIGK
jgi:hypothetical protein